MSFFQDWVRQAETHESSDPPSVDEEGDFPSRTATARTATSSTTPSSSPDPSPPHTPERHGGGGSNESSFVTYQRSPFDPYRLDDDGHAVSDFDDGATSMAIMAGNFEQNDANTNKSSTSNSSNGDNDRRRRGKGGGERRSRSSRHSSSNNNKDRRRSRGDDNNSNNWSNKNAIPYMERKGMFGGCGGGCGDNPRQRRRIFWALVAVVVIVLVVAITVPVAMSSSKDKSSSSSAVSSTSDVENDEPNDFDFTGVNSTITTTTTPAEPVPTSPPSTASPSGFPSDIPSNVPSVAPSESRSPSLNPTSSPTVTESPTSMPSFVPTSTPTAPIPPVAAPPILPIDETSDTLLTFCVIADVPYDEKELEALPGQIQNQMEGCEFLVHLGDLFIGDTTCEEKSYHDVRDVMLQSTVPTFVVVGDNEWNDCVRNRIDAGWELWTQEFLRFENKWSHNMTVVRQPGFEENFYFIEKRTLIIGLNLVGGRVHNATEWKSRQEEEYAWTKSVIDTFVPAFADGVILMAHAKPSIDQRFFMDPLRNDMALRWNNAFPILYLHGDGHSWVYSPHFKGQPNMLRVQHEGGVRDPILKVLADPTRNGPEVYSAFQFDRQLDLA